MNKKVTRIQSVTLLHDATITNSRPPPLAARLHVVLGTLGLESLDIFSRGCYRSETKITYRMTNLIPYANREAFQLIT